MPHAPDLTSIPSERIDELFARLDESNSWFASRYPGETGARQAVHTLYGGAQLFKATTAPTVGRLALASLEQYAPTASDLGMALAWDIDDALEPVVYSRVVAKLEREPVEDLRIDFEDGYGNRPDQEEDDEALRTAAEVAAAHRAGTLPPFFGIRIKPLSGELARRSVRTLDLFLSALADELDSELPPGFVVTLPKVSLPEQVRALTAVLEELEAAAGLELGSTRVELMVETPQSLINADGYMQLPALIDAGSGRVVAAHFGTYDYTAGSGITAAHQHMAHPACDLARGLMQIALAGRGIQLSDGATNVMPIGPHRAVAGAALTTEQQQQNLRVVHDAWRLSFEHVTHSLETAFYQGWDLHPAQLPVRYAAVYAFFLSGLEQATLRLRNFVDMAAQATLVGDVFDDAATGQGLLNFFLRGLACGALTEQEVLATGLTRADLQTRSFVAIMERRAAAS